MTPVTARRRLAFPSYPQEGSETVRILTVAGAKGGIAKTTTSIALAAELAAQGRRVLLIDLDPQSSGTLAIGELPAADPWHAPTVSVRLAPGVELGLRRGGRPLALAGSADVHDYLVRVLRDADVAVLDTPPFLGALTLAGLAAAGLVIVPVDPAPMALPGIRDIAGAVAQLGRRAPRMRAALVRVQSRRAVTADIRADLEESFPGVLYRSEIPEDVRVVEAPAYGMPITVYAPRSRAAEAYRQLAAEVAEDLFVGRARASA
ncbi:MAG: ParA family protein [Gemmatimonadetes bacterium]|nr:ParA family protein [Gemmatimonadota bacterium]